MTGLGLLQRLLHVVAVYSEKVCRRAGLTLLQVLRLEQPWELCCHTHGYSYNPRGAHILAQSPLQSLMNYAPHPETGSTEAVLILLCVPQSVSPVLYLS